jgi:hypothetical protein
MISDQRFNLKESPEIKYFTLSKNADFVKDSEAKIMLIKMNGVMNFRSTFLSENKRIVESKNNKINIKPELEEE